MKTEAEWRRLQWQCRRGMLELDVLLQKFFQQRYHHLSSSDQQQFARLLQENDQDLFIWLTGREQPVDQELARMINLVREHASTSHQN